MRHIMTPQSPQRTPIVYTIQQITMRIVREPWVRTQPQCQRVCVFIYSINVYICAQAIKLECVCVCVLLSGCMFLCVYVFPWKLCTAINLFSACAFSINQTWIPRLFVVHVYMYCTHTVKQKPPATPNEHCVRVCRCVCVYASRYIVKGLFCLYSVLILQFWVHYAPHRA